MCGRFAITLPDDAMAALFEAAASNDLPPVPNYNVCPTDSIHAVTSDAGSRRLRPMRWGFVPHWAKTATEGPLLINARSETIAEKPAFRGAVRERRCLVPASGFYEWMKDPEDKRIPFYIHAANDAPLAFAGVWQDWERDGQRLTTCAILTTAANRKMSAIHHRMPVIVAPEDWPLWLGEAGKGAAILMRPAPDDLLISQRVSTKVNSNRASGPDLIEAI